MFGLPSNGEIAGDVLLGSQMERPTYSRVVACNERALRQGNSFFVEITCTDDENYRD
jgi:hypothetical protein